MRIEYIGKCLLIANGKEKVLAVGDLHLGFEESLNRSGVFVSRQMYDEMISDFDGIFEDIRKRINVQSGIKGASELKRVATDNNESEENNNKNIILDKIILLGDVKHDFGRISGQEWGDVNRLIDYLGQFTKEIIIIKGNHDTILKPLLERMDKKKIKFNDYYIWKDFCFLHGDRDFGILWDDNKNIKHIVAGHIHPAVKLREGIKVEKYKCFLSGEFRGKEMIIVPSFIEYHIGTDPREGEEDFLAWQIKFDNFDVRIVSENLEVLDFGKLKNLK